jgi:hypothetical protein
MRKGSRDDAIALQSAPPGEAPRPFWPARRQPLQPPVSAQQGEAADHNSNILCQRCRSREKRDCRQ